MKILLHLLAVAGVCCAAERSATDILKAIDAIRAPGPTFAFDLTVVSTPRGKSPTTQKFKVSVKDLSKSLVRFTDPPENRGRVLLMSGQNLWIQIPNTNQPVRIAPQQRLLGQVSNGDVARVVYSIDYEPALKGRETVDGKECNKLDLKAKTPEAAYGHIILWSEAANDRPVKAEFYSTDDRLIKSAVYTGYEDVLGKQRPLRMEVTDAIRKGDVTTMEQQNLRLDDMPASAYEKDNLRYVH